MEETIFKIGDHDYSGYIEAGGYERSISERGRIRITDLGGVDHKFRRAVKDVLRVTFTLLPEHLRRQLEEDLAAPSFVVTYLGRGGPVSRTCATDTGLVATLQCRLDDGLYWGTVQLEVYEL